MEKKTFPAISITIRYTFTDQEKLPMFYGNLTDYFKILDQDDSTLLIGARYCLKKQFKKKAIYKFNF